MRKVPVLIAAAALFALLNGVPPATAARVFHACPKLRTRTGKVTNIRTQYGCVYTRTKLRALLRKGVDGIPEPRLHSGRWGCRLASLTWSCRKYPRRGKAGRRIRFRLDVEIETGGGSPPSSGGAPPSSGDGSGPVSALERCADLWNADEQNRALFGYHIYTHHGVRRLWVFELPQSKRCAVIAVVPATDPEFGNDGEVRNVSGGWTFMRDVAELGDPVAVQTQAPTGANASLNPDYTITPD